MDTNKHKLSCKEDVLQVRLMWKLEWERLVL